MEHEEKNVIRLAWISLLNDLGSETITRLVPFYVSGVLGAPMAVVGLIEGLADATSTLLKPYFGRISDRLGKRKSFVTTGYALSSLTRPLLAIAMSPAPVIFLRVVDRFGKAVRTAPRDSLISVTRSERKQGWRFGINRAMDTFGAALGIGLFALFVHAKTSGGGSVLQLTATEWRALCLASIVPAILCLAIVIWGIVEASGSPALAEAARAKHPRGRNRILIRYLAAVGLFGLASSSDAFILLRGKDMGFSLLQILGMILLLNVFSSATALPAAVLSDRFGRKTLISAGWLIYAGTYIAIGIGFGSHSALEYSVLVGLYGLFYGFTEGVEKAWVADLTHPEDRGRAYGWFGLVTGMTALPASVVFGWAWDRFGDQLPFLAGGALAATATLMLWALVPSPKQQGASP